MESPTAGDALPLVDSRNLHIADPAHLRRDFAFFVKTVQAYVVRALIDAMKEIVADTNIIFSPEGIVVKAIDTPQNAMVYLNLGADQFEEYICDETQVCGVSLINLHRLLKTMSSTDVLMLYMRRGAEVIDIRIDNSKKAKTSHFQLFMLDLPKTSMKPLQPDLSHAVAIESVELHKIIREMKDISENLDIRVHNNTIRFKSVFGSYAEASVFLGITRRGDSQVAAEDIAQGVFSLKYLSMFTKCTPLSKDVVLFLKNDYPLIVQYNVSNMGTIQLALMMEDDRNG